MTREQWIKAWTLFTWACLFLAIAGWPLSAFWFAKKEPQTVLALSWIAIIIGALGNLIMVYVFRKVDDE